MTCTNCGGEIIGDGYTSVMHCENVEDLDDTLEPDAHLVLCEQVKTETCSICGEEIEPGHKVQVFLRCTTEPEGSWTKPTEVPESGFGPGKDKLRRKHHTCEEN